MQHSCSRSQSGWVLFLLAAAFLAPAASSQIRPNVVWIYIDDLNTDIGPYGHPIVRTPNLDRIARRGMVFDNAICPAPLCDPSRTAVMSGKRPHHAHQVDNRESRPRVRIGTSIAGTPTLPYKFRGEGYRVGGAGKIFHVRVDPANWDEYYNPTDDPLQGPSDPNPRGQIDILYGGPVRDGPTGALGKLADTKSTDLAIDMIRRFAGQPFFVAVGYHKPHFPFVYPERFEPLYPQQTVPPLPALENTNWRSGIPADVYLSHRLHPDFASHPDPDYGRRVTTAQYWRSITYVDAEIGRVLDTIAALGLEQNTIVVVESDNGWSNGHHGQFFKYSPYEWGTRAPMMLAVPWMPVAHGVHTARPAEHIHLYPTLMQLCGFAPPAGLDGRSLVPLLADRQAPFPPAFSLTTRGWGLQWGWTVRSERYAFVRWHDGTDLLFDLAVDPGQYTNIASRWDAAPIVAQHVQHLRDAGLLAASWTNYGEETPGTSGPPTLTCAAPPALGASTYLELGNSAGFGVPALLTLGNNPRQPWPLLSGLVYGDPVWQRAMVLPARGLRLPLVIPNAPELDGLVVALQLMLVDPGADQGLAMSRALRLAIRP